MSTHQIHSKKNIQYDLLSQFTHKNFYYTPQLKKIVLNFGIKEINLKTLVLVMAALEVISTQKPIITKSKKSNVFLKIRQGAPVGCKLHLRKKAMHSFFSKFVSQILPNIKLFEGIKMKNENSFSFSLYDLLIFPELEIQYDLFQNTPKLDISILTTVNSCKESKVLFTGSQFFLK